MPQEIIDQIKKKSREQWLKDFQGRLTSFRLLIQERGELFFVLGALLGIFFVFFYKLVVFILVIGVLIGFGIWFTAPPEESMRSQGGEDDPRGPLDGAPRE